MLPAVTRSANGYRRYDQTHVLSVRAYRALAVGAGFARAREVLQAVHCDEVGKALALLDAAHSGVHDERRAVAQARAAADVIAAEPILSTSADSMTIGELADALGLRPSALRFWEAQGLVKADRAADRSRVFSSGQIRDVRIVAQLRAAGYSVPLLRELLAQLGDGNADEVRVVLARRQRSVTGRSRALVAGAAEIHALLELSEARVTPSGIA